MAFPERRGAVPLLPACQPSRQPQAVQLATASCAVSCYATAICGYTLPVEAFGGTRRSQWLLLFIKAGLGVEVEPCFFFKKKATLTAAGLSFSFSGG
jgi:hypothetical protein